jgi:SAM-dependent methyltransferase
MNTDDYYIANAYKYTSENSDTFNVSMQEFYPFFEKYLQKNENILDIGFGSGRDSLYFASRYNVTSIDVIPEFIQHGKEIGLRDVQLQRIEDIEYENMFNGIWACASLLHLNNEYLSRAIDKIIVSSKKHCIFYTSFKYGDSENITEERYFNNMNETKFTNIFNRKEFTILDIIISEDKLQRKNKWLNAYILIKK